MDSRRKRLNGSEMKIQVTIGDIRSEIDLDGLELLKLEFGEPGTQVTCTTGTLWLTQQGDPHDHILKAGQSFSLDQPGIILVQGLPRGKVLIRKMVNERVYHQKNSSSQWDNSQI
jgi:hypothetical protein